MLKVSLLGKSETTIEFLCVDGANSADSLQMLASILFKTLGSEEYSTLLNHMEFMRVNNVIYSSIEKRQGPISVEYSDFGRATISEYRDVDEQDPNEEYFLPEGDFEDGKETDE